MKQAKTPAIVTRESLQALLDNAPTIERQAQIVGRALVVLFNRQTEGERSSNSTNQDNMRGFASADARGGSLSAKSFIKHSTLQTWQVQKWTATQKNGFAKLCKYHRQLNEAAMQRAKALDEQRNQNSLLA